VNILLVEDDQFKARRLEDLIKSIDQGAQVQWTHSVTSATQGLEDAPRDLVVLDMSLPTFDVGPRESGGKPQGFGGREVMRFMIHNDIETPVIIVTQFEKFGEVGKETDLPTLADSLRNEFPALFRGVVYYDAASDKWRDELSRLFLAEKLQK
jgi:CheY-like chemotaxis protein